MFPIKFGNTKGPCISYHVNNNHMLNGYWGNWQRAQFELLTVWYSYRTKYLSLVSMFACQIRLCIAWLELPRWVTFRDDCPLRFHFSHYIQYRTEMLHIQYGSHVRSIPATDVSEFKYKTKTGHFDRSPGQKLGCCVQLNNRTRFFHLLDILSTLLFKNNPTIQCCIFRVVKLARNKYTNRNTFLNHIQFALL
jgi:hypothetical protein